MKSTSFAILASAAALIILACGSPTNAGPDIKNGNPVVIGTMSGMLISAPSVMGNTPGDEDDLLGMNGGAPEIDAPSSMLQNTAPNALRHYAMRPSINDYSVPVFGQQWGPWAGDILGWNGNGYRSTIGQYGCALSCIAMEQSYFRGYSDPRSMNNWMRRHGGFYYDLVNFGAAPGYAGSYDYSRSKADLNRINSLLDQGYLVIAMTYAPPYRRTTHFVLITSHWGNMYYINDPWAGDRSTFLGRYGDAERWIYNIFYFH